MKGLLIKDFKLLKTQKNFFVVMIVISVGLALFSEDLSFPIGFSTFVFSLFSLSSISYDEFDNGSPFLFSLPITRADYVTEKYTFGLILAFGAWLCSTLLVLIAASARGVVSFTDLLLTALLILPFLFLLLSIMLPIQLKFGGEKGRIALIGAIGAIFLAAFLVIQIAQAFGIDLLLLLNRLPAPSVGAVAAVSILVTFLLLLLSLRISIGIVNRKEF